MLLNCTQKPRRCGILPESHCVWLCFPVPQAAADDLAGDPEQDGVLLLLHA
ncbi:MAG: hypothetical protein IKN55_03375 [Oscillospiraceae bacterium]|nr:hypothetical protein [Oscillospiraceae bacterium]